MDLSDILASEVNTGSSSAVIDTETTAPVMDEPEYVEPIQVENVAPEPGGIPGGESRSMPPKHLAEIIVGMVNGFQSSLIPYFRKQAIFTAKELEILETLNTAGGTIYPPESPEAKILQKWRKHMEIASLLPFSDAEKERLTSATENYCSTMQITVSPFMGLLAAFGEVAATRAVYLMSE